MAYLPKVAESLMGLEDWSGYSVGDLYDALLEMTYSTLPDAVQVGDQDARRFWTSACKPNIDFLLYMYCDPLGAWPENRPVSECVERSRGMQLGRSSGHSLLVYYFNVYFYKYISMEISRLNKIATVNSDMTFEMAVKHFITTLVYEGIGEEYPGTYLGYDEMAFVPAGRKQAFAAVAEDICAAHRSGDEVLMFRSVFYLMTYFAGSSYRRVHDAVTTLLGIDMASFRGQFYENLPRIVRDKGSVNISGIEC